jgi:hypothetical protein
VCYAAHEFVPLEDPVIKGLAWDWSIRLDPDGLGAHLLSDCDFEARVWTSEASVGDTPALILSTYTEQESDRRVTFALDSAQTTALAEGAIWVRVLGSIPSAAPLDLLASFKAEEIK